VKYQFADDYYRYYGCKIKWSSILNLFKDQSLWFLYLFRTLQAGCPSIIRQILYLLLFFHSKKYGLEIPLRVQIGKGFYMGHAYNITINSEAKLGNNINIHKGVTIGQENRGKRKGAPTIGDCVWIGVNTTIVGNIKIGDDVLIAPNSYVNTDVPSHSIVIGNPCKIIPRENATENYINWIVDYNNI